MLSDLHNFQNHPPRQRKRGFLVWFLAVMITLGIAFFVSIAIAYKFYSTSRKVITQNTPASFLDSLKEITSIQRKPLRGESEGRINILLLGLAGENYPGENLTDSIIIASIHPQTYQTALLSIPRDLYVSIPDTNSYTKINALYARGQEKNGKTEEGIEDLKKTLVDITGLPIHYYIAIDFNGFKKVIDELGGVKIQVPKDIHDERYPGPNYSYETFDIQKGLHNLDGETALKYARTRHDEEGDFGRAFRQQQILEAVRSKAFSASILLNLPAINNILDTLGNHLRTDISLNEMNSFKDLFQKIDTHLTINKVLDAGKPDSLLAVSHVFLGNVRTFILIPRTGKYDEIRELAKNIFNLEIIERKKKEIANEKATLAVVNASGVNGFNKKISVILQKMGYSNFVDVKPLQRNERESVVYDISQTKPFSLEDLTKKFSVKVSQNPPAEILAQCQKADLCLVAGSDLVENLNYEENTIEDLEEGYDKTTVEEKEYIELLKKGNKNKF